MILYFFFISEYNVCSSKASLHEPGDDKST